MKLKSFRVTKFRNVVDSGEIEVDDDVTCLVGKNEAGKSALLEALYLLHPAYGESLQVEDQYPRWLLASDRRTMDLSTWAPVQATFHLEPQDLEAVADILGEGCLADPTVSLTRTYGGSQQWAISVNESSVVAFLISRMPKTVQPRVRDAIELDALRGQLKALVPVDDDGPTTEDLALANEVLIACGVNEVSATDRARDILSSRLPRFFRFTAYDTLPGRVDFQELAPDPDAPPASSAIQIARALLKLAGAELHQLRNEDYELRRSELEAVQIDLTKQVFEYWTQNPDLEVLIDVDKETIGKPNNQSAVTRFLDIRLRDRRTGYSNNFEQRSSGFQWFFSFLAAFSEFENAGPTVVLLDEPALTLHGRAQGDFLRFINERLAPGTPVLYTTHSPFMIEPGRLGRVRIVEDLGPPRGAVAHQEVTTTDPDSLFPLQAALGYDIAQNLFVGPHNLVVEGTSDFTYLTVMSQVCARAGREALDERWRVLPAGGATNLPTFVSLVGPHLDVTVLADSDTKGMQRVRSMVDRGLLRGHRLILASAATSTDDADIEDLFSEGDYLKLFNKTFGSALKLSDLPPGSRIVKRLEDHAGDFDHGRVAETLLRHHHEFSFTDTTIERFESLIRAINQTIDS